MRQVIELLLAGGPFMMGLLITSVVSVAIIIYRVAALWFRYKLPVEQLQDQLVGLIHHGDYPRAAQLCAGDHPLLRMLTAVFERANRPEKELRRGLEARAVTELARFRKGTAALPQLSNLATLLGLLGTIHGLIIAFSGMQGMEAAARQAALSKGVAVAFYNTFFGLTVATITVVAYLIVSSKQNKELVRMEAATNTVIDQVLLSHQQPPTMHAVAGGRR